jgi:hypothetical protein
VKDIEILGFGFQDIVSLSFLLVSKQGPPFAKVNVGLLELRREEDLGVQAVTHYHSA